MGESEEDAKRLVEAVEKLVRESANLRRDVRTLTARFTGMDRAPPVGEVRPIRTIREALGAIAEARRDIRNVERDFASTRAAVDSIAGDVLSREEMKGWLIERPSARKRGG